MLIKGLGASNGYAIGRVYKYDEPKLIIPQHKIDDVDGELQKFHTAISKSENELLTIRDKIIEKIDRAHGDIFDAHIQIIKDPELMGQTIDKIKNERYNAAYALSIVALDFIRIFESMEDSYMRERAIDIKDVSKRVIRNLLGISANDLSLIDESVILVARDLTPSDTAQLDRRFIKAFVIDIGGKTSHSSIMAQTLEIPAVVGAKNAFDTINNNDEIIVDGEQGKVILNPSIEEKKQYNGYIKRSQEEKHLQRNFIGKPSVTVCGHCVELAANIGTPKDVEGVISNDGEGVGLYRTEFLYMNSDHMPTEEEQYVAYKTVLEKLAPRPIVIRTLDIGGDKSLPYLKIPKEDNPFLGHRAIRLCLAEEELFRNQLRALLRASIYGNLNIMFPMIATLEEFRKAKAIFEDVKKELTKNKVAYSDMIQLGIMVEIPSVAMMADKFAKEVDFFSIGTNDLIQYTFAADRMNEQVSYLYQPYHPSILRMIKNVIDASHQEGKWTGMCGQMAGDRFAIPLLIGMGLDEFSMSATSILPSRAMISKIQLEKAKVLLEKALDAETNEQVQKIVENYLEEIER